MTLAQLVALLERLARESKPAPVTLPRLAWLERTAP